MEWFWSIEGLWNCIVAVVKAYPEAALTIGVVSVIYLGGTIGVSKNK